MFNALSLWKKTFGEQSESMRKMAIIRNFAQLHSMKCAYIQPCTHTHTHAHTHTHNNENTMTE